MEVTIVVVDNNSKDDTAEVVKAMQAATSRALVYVRETKQGLSNARNGGIRASSGDVLGFIDDDEEIDAQWFNVVAREFADERTQFIGGPYLANREAALPSWIPAGYNAVIGVTPVRPRTQFGPEFAGNLNGGNAVIRRSAFDVVGLYDPKLGRSGKGLLSEEDAELYRRLLAAGMLGFYVPDLVILHHIPESRLTRKYYRRWTFWRGLSHGVADRERKEAVPYLFGLPRYRVRNAVRGLMAMPRNLSATKGEGKPFADELAFWDLLGFVRGKYFTRIESFYADKK
jgi:glucosyl-dolichyl phosphate glucuronosyltransferase